MLIWDYNKNIYCKVIFLRKYLAMHSTFTYTAPGSMPKTKLLENEY